MKRIGIIVGIALVSMAALVYVFKRQVGNLGPAILPPAKLTDSAKTGGAVGLKVPNGYKIGLFAASINGARDLELSPGGTVLASQPDSGIVSALPDKDFDGASEGAKTVIRGLNRPHGLTFYQGKLYVAEETRVVRYNWDENNLSASVDKQILSLPAGGNHRTRSLVFDRAGKLYISLGSTCNICVETHPFLATVIVTDAEGAGPRVYAKGLRNTVFLAVRPETDELWGADMGRDFLGDNLPPDEVNLILDNKDYGWPYCHSDKVQDTGLGRRDCGGTEAPKYKIPAHSAPLGLVFVTNSQQFKDLNGDILLAYHGSWNRSVPDGYKVVRLKFKDGQISGEEDFITGFLSGNQAVARPVDLLFDKQGSLYLSDDKAGQVYKIIKEK